MRDFSKLQYIGKVFKSDPFSSLYAIDEEGTVWLVNQSGRTSNQGTVDDFRDKLEKGRLRFHAFTDGVRTELVGRSKIIRDWK